MKERMRPNAARAFRTGLGFVLCVAVLFAAAGQAAAQQKKNKKDTPAPDNGPVVPLNDEQQIDYTISTMLGAWQVGDIEKLHSCYADDVAIVSAAYNPPAIGWNTYLPLYQQQRARMQQVRMDRSNTLIKVNGTSAWATYQWDFSGIVDGQQVGSQGHTTLVMEKRNGKWLIVLNHTSATETRPGNSAAPAQPH
ncbi:MAG: nuclear transport factor 2 family protein [Candidatus Acidiferrum sp.]